MGSLQRRNLGLLRAHFFFGTFAGTSVAPFTVQIFDKAFGIPASLFTAILIARFTLDGISRPLISTFIDRNPGQHVNVMRLLLAAEIISWAILLLPSPPLDPTDTLVLECAGKSCHYLRMEEDVLGGDFREKMRAIYGERRFDCEATCDNGASFETSFSRNTIDSGVGSEAARFFRFPVAPELTLQSHIPSSSFYAEPKCRLRCDDDELTRALGGGGSLNLFGERHRFFLLVLAAHVVLAAATPGMMSYSVTLANRILEDVPGEDFGAQRIYGSFGAVVSGVTVGLWRYSQTAGGLRSSVADFAPVIAAYAAGSCLNILALSRVRLKSGMEDRKRDDDKVKVAEDDSASDRTRKLLDVFCTPRGVNILILNTVCGVAFGSFMAAYKVLDDLDGSGGSDMKLVQGLSVAASTLAEIPAMQVSGGLMSRLGADNLFAAATLALSVKAAYFGMMTSIWAALPIEAVVGFVFSLYWPSSAKIFDEMAPEGTKNTVQGLGAFSFALSAGLGITLSALSSDTYGAQPTFLSIGMCGIIVVVIQRLLTRRTSKRHRS